MDKANDVYYYSICVSYEIPYNIIDSDEPGVKEARQELFDHLTSSIPSEKYEKFSVKVVLHQLEDTLNYLVTFTAFFRTCEGLPMEEYVGAREIKESIETEIEDFLERIDCEYRKVIIKPIS
jgi:hypothetical protein